MKALVCQQPGSLQYVTKERPVAEKGRAVLKLKRIGIWGTDLHAFAGMQPFFAYPRVLGRELGGEIVQFDGLKDNFKSWLDPKTGVIKAMVEV